MNEEIKSHHPGLYKRLITDRNRKWLPLIEAYEKTPETELVLVGAGHLAGTDGIIELLRKNAYRVVKLQIGK